MNQLTQQTSLTTTYEVQLAIYDLSHGMARNLSAQFLGPQHAIEIIPHTALIVFGREYYFGGGIQSVLPNEFRRSTGMFPIQTESLGRTRVTQQQFEQWCRDMMARGLYHAAAYDLLQRNCNHFCHDAALQGLQLSQGVPAWILDVPRRFLASPMGQLVRPMLEQMQVTAPVGGVGGATFQPTNSTNTAFATPVLNNNQATTTTTNVPQTNPWAQVPSHATAASSTPATTDSAASSPPTTVKTPLLDSFHAPLLSNDTKTVSICVSKLTAVLGNGTNDDDDLVHQRKEALQSVGDVLSRGQKPSTLALENACDALLSLFSTSSAAPTPTRSTTITFALMLLRLLVLQTPPESSPSASWQSCLELVQSELIGGKTKAAIITSPAARAMAWCVLSNAVGAVTSAATTATATPTMPLGFLNNESTCDSPHDNYADWLEKALSDWLPDSQPRVEIRQAVGAFFYNVVLAQRLEKSDMDELPDLHVSLLCAALIDLAAEPDATARLRRLMVAARLVLPQVSAKTARSAVPKPLPSTAAVRLIRDLDFTASLHDLLSTTPTNGKSGGDAEKCRTLISELLSVVEG